MKFRYKFRNSENVPQEGVLSARRREDVYSILAKQKIKPFFVEKVPDPYRSVRIIAIVVVSFCVAVAGWRILTYLRNHGVLFTGNERISNIADPESRRQLYGDPIVIERGVANDWPGVDLRSCERFLARYAQPGWKVRETMSLPIKEVVEELKADSDAPIKYAENDLPEYRQLKKIIAGMKKELTEFLRDGGSVERYLVLLEERQDKERGLRAEIVEKFANREASLTGSRLLDSWADANRRLRSLGLRTIPIPEDAEEEYGNLK